MVNIAKKEMQRLRNYYQEYLLLITRHELEIEALNKKWQNVERIYASFGVGTKSQGELKKGRVFREIEQEIATNKAAMEELQKFLDGEDGIQGKFVQAIRNNNMTEIEQLAKNTDYVAAKFVYACSLYSKDRTEATKFLKACETDREYYGNLVKAVPFLAEFAEKDYNVRIQLLKSEKSSGRIKSEAMKIQGEFSAFRKSMQDLLRNDVVHDEYKHHFDKIESQIRKWEDELNKVVQEVEAQERSVNAARREAKENRRNSFKVTIMNVVYGVVLIYLMAIGFPGCVIEWEGRTSFFYKRITAIANLLPAPIYKQVVLDSDYQFPVIFLKNPLLDTVVLKGNAAEKPVIMLADQTHYFTLEDYEGENYEIPIDCEVVTIQNCSNLQSITNLGGAGSLYVTNCPNLQSIEAPESVTHIELTNCPNLQSVEALGCDNVQLTNCLKLRSIDVADEDIEMKFTDYSNLEDIAAPENMDYIETVNIPNTQYKEDSYVKFNFYNCLELQSIIVPKGVEAVYLFNCQSLQSIMISEGVKIVTLEECPNLQSIMISEGAEKVVLDNCPGLQSILAPETVERLAIYECPNLIDINCLNPECEIKFE